MTEQVAWAKLVSSKIEGLRPYEAGKPVEEVERELGISGALKLASNENAFGAPPAALLAAQEAVRDLERYPDAAYFNLRSALASHHGLARENIVVGNGSNEIINMIVRVFTEVGDEVLSSSGSFIAYKIAAHSHHVDFREARLGSDFGYDLDALAEAVTPKTRVIFIANPNNPTGTFLTAAALESFTAKVDAQVFEKGPPIIVFDEAYNEFVCPERYSVADRKSGELLLASRPLTIVLRTFSKAYGLAALRVGYALCHPQVANYLNRVRDPFNLNAIGQKAATSALSEQAWVEQTTQVIRQERERVHAELVQLGLEPIESQANFILVDMKRPAAAVNDALMRRGVIVRPMGAAGFPTFVRYTIGQPQDNDVLLKALSAILTQ